MKHLYTCLGKISSFVFSQQTKFSCRFSKMSNHGRLLIDSWFWGSYYFFSKLARNLLVISRIHRNFSWLLISKDPSTGEFLCAERRRMNIFWLNKYVFCITCSFEFWPNWFHFWNHWFLTNNWKNSPRIQQAFRVHFMR